MRRAKIRPSINLSAVTRRSAAAPAAAPVPAAKAKDPAPSTPKGGVPQTRFRSASKPTTPQPSEPQPIVSNDVPKGNQAQQCHQENWGSDQVQQQAQSENEQELQQQQQQQPKQHEQDKWHQQDEELPQDSTPSSADVSSPAPIQPIPVSPAIKPPLASPPSPSEPTPQSPTNTTSSSAVRRKRITAIPNLGQLRMRAGPSQPLKTRAAKAITTTTPQVPREVEAERGGTRGKVGGADRGRPTAGEGEMGPPLRPPPIQRIMATSAPSTKTPNKEITRTTPTRHDAPALPKTVPSQTISTPIAVTTPRRPSLARSDSSVSDKRPQGSDNIYEKKLQELKDRMDSETPSRKRRHYGKHKVQTPERSKMTMSDLIYFNPKTSPMKNTTVSKEKKFPRTIMTEHVVSANNSVNNSAHNSENEDEDEQEEKEDDVEVDPFAPRVKIGPDGSIILDSTSLVKDASPAKTLHISDDDVIQEDASHTTYSSFRKKTFTRAWNKKDTAKFYRALSAVGTDFSMIKAMFPKRTRHQIKNKFKREERCNRHLLDKAIRERQHFDRSLFNIEPSSESELENRVKKRTSKEKGANKSAAKGKGKGRGKGRGKAKRSTDTDDKDSDIDSDLESIDVEVGAKEEGSKDAGEKVSKDGDTKVAEGAANDRAAGQSGGSEDEIDMETILSHPTRSGRQPKIKTNFSAKEPEKRRRSGYRKSPTTEDQGYAARRMERLNREREIVLARKEAAKRNFPPYAPGGLLPSPSSHPRNLSTREASPAGGRQAYSSPYQNAGGSRVSPGSRGISTITTSMGRFIVSVPQQQSSPRPVGSPSPDGTAKKAQRTHIFVISSPDGTHNIIHVPIQPDPASAFSTSSPSQDTGQPQRPAPAQNPSTSGPKFHNPMTTPRIVVRTLCQNPQQTSTAMLQNPQQTPTAMCQNPQQTPTAMCQNPQQTATAVRQNPQQTPTVMRQNPQQTPTVICQNPQQTPTAVRQNPQQTPTAVRQNPQQTATVILQNPQQTLAAMRQNPQQTPTAMRQNPQQTATVMHQVDLPSAEACVTQWTTNQSGNGTPNAAALSSPLGFAATQNRCVMVERSPHQQDKHYHIGKRWRTEPLALQSPGTNKVIIISPHHAQLPSASFETHNLVTSLSNLGSSGSHEICSSPKVVTQHHHHSPDEAMYHHHQDHNLTLESNQKVSHMTSDMDTDWLLRDGTVGHEVDIPTSDFSEEVVETEEAFIPPASNVGNPSPHLRHGMDQEVMDHVTDEHLSAQDILDQMTYEEGVDGDVGANLEVALKEEIITQIASEMEAE